MIIKTLVCEWVLSDSVKAAVTPCRCQDKQQLLQQLVGSSWPVGVLSFSFFLCLTGR